MAQIYMNTVGVETCKYSLKNIGNGVQEAYEGIRTVGDQLEMKVASSSSILSRLRSVQNRVKNQATAIDLYVDYLTTAQERFTNADKTLANKGKETISLLDAVLGAFRNIIDRIQTIMSLYATGLAERIKRLMGLFGKMTGATFGIAASGYLRTILSGVGNEAGRVSDITGGAKDVLEALGKADDLGDWMKVLDRVSTAADVVVGTAVVFDGVLKNIQEGASGSKIAADAITETGYQVGKHYVKNAAGKLGAKGGVIVGTKVGGIIGSIFPGAGTAIGAGIGAVVGGAIGYVAASGIAEYLMDSAANWKIFDGKSVKELYSSVVEEKVDAVVSVAKGVVKGAAKGAKKLLKGLFG